jgi:hypothetical protein
MSRRRILRFPPCGPGGGELQTTAVAGSEDQGGGGDRSRPVFVTAQVKALLVVWLAVTLVLVFVYAIVLVLL